MANKIPRVPVREQDPKVRATNFEEVCYGYNVERVVTKKRYVPLPELQESPLRGGVSGEYPYSGFHSSGRGG